MKLEVVSFSNNTPIPDEYAYCNPSTKNHVQPGKNINPHLRWSGVPSNAQSLALIMVDPDVPTVFDNANKEGMTISKDLPRRDFYHWVLVDIPTSVQEIKKGQDSNGITPGGKKPGATPYGIRGINHFSKDSSPHGGYDGPCPPWNDELVHHYHFKLYALDVKSLGLKDEIDGPSAKKALQNHIIAQSEWVGTYTLNPNIKK